MWNVDGNCVYHFDKFINTPQLSICLSPVRPFLVHKINFLVESSSQKPKLLGLMVKHWPGHCSHNGSDYSNLPLKNVSELSEEKRLGPGLRQRGAGGDGDQREAGDQEQDGLHDDEILGGYTEA